MADLHRGEEILFGNLRGATFHHEKTLARARVDQVKVTLLALGVRGVDHEFAMDTAHTHTADRPHEGDIRDMEGSRGGVDGKDVGVVLGVCREHHVVDLDIIPIALREERPDGAVGDACREDFLLARPRLAFEKSAGEPADRVILLAVFDLQREEVDPLARLVRAGHSGEHQGITQTADGGSGSLTREQSGLNGHRGPAHLDGDRGCILHRVSPFSGQGPESVWPGKMAYSNKCRGPSESAPGMSVRALPAARDRRTAAFAHD